MSEIRVVRKHMQPLCFLPSGKLVAYSFGTIFILENEVVVKKIRVFTNIKETIIGRCRLGARLFRLGIRATEVIDESHIIISVSNMIYELNLDTGVLSNGYFCGTGVRPLMFTNIHGLSSISNGVYWGGYLGNHNKQEVHIYKRVSVDNWEVVYTFKQGEINHIHTILCDPYRECLWIFTGDFGEAAAIWKVTDNFKYVEKVRSANQKYRGCVVFALPEGLLYATDAPFASNSLYIMDTSTYELREVLPISGSCIYGCRWKDKYVFSTTVEGDGRNMSKFELYFGRTRGSGIKDEYVHLYIGNLKSGFKDVYKARKDCLPFYTFQFGVFKFPYGQNLGDSLYFQPIATKYNDLNLIRLKWDL